MIIYQIYCRSNNKSYIGITNNLKRRMTVHKNSTADTVLNRTVLKYGKDNFTLNIIDRCKTWEEACKKERWYIKELNTHVPNGLNMTDGGEGVFGLKHSEKTKLQMSVSHKGKRSGMYGKTGPNLGKKFSEETRKRISESRIGIEPWNKDKKCPQLNGEGNGFFGKSHSLETKKHLSKAAVGRKHSKETRNKISIAAKNRVGEKSNQAKLNEQCVIDIRKEYMNPGITQKALAEKYNITQSMVHCIIARKSWTHI